MRDILFFLAYMIFMEPRYFFYVSSIDHVFRLMMYFTLMVLLIFYLFFWKYPKRAKVTIFVILYHIYLVGVTISKGGAVSDIRVDAVIFVGLTILTEVVANENPSFFFHGLLYLLIGYLFLNFLSIVFFPKGLYSTQYFSTNYFLGYDNQNVNIMLPALVLAVGRKKYNIRFSKILLCITLFLDLFTVLTFRSGASMVVIALMLLLSLPMFSNKTKFFNSTNYFILNMVMFFGIVVFRMQELFRFLIVDILGKDLTLTGRTYIWDRAWYFIKKNPIFGYGVESYIYRGAKMNLPAVYPAGLHAHDRYIETLYRGGVILLVVYIFILLFFVIGSSKNKESEIAKVLTVGIFVYLTGMLTEFYKYSYLFFPMLLMGELSGQIDIGLRQKHHVLDYLLSKLKIRSAH